MAADYYEILNISRNATDAEIRKAYYRQMRLWRSRLNAPDLKLRQEAESKLEELNAAKKVLLNTKQYDFDKPKSPKRPSPKHKRDRSKSKQKKPLHRKKFSPFKKIKLAFKIATKGLSGAVKYVLNLIGNYIRRTIEFILLTIWRIIKFLALAIGILLLVSLLITGFGGLMLFAAGIYQNQLDQASIAIAYNYFAIGIVTFVNYYLDKQKAKRGAWRISEAQLHFLELFGGWFGAFLGQVLLQHKSSKESFQKVYWLIVLFHFSLFLFFIPASFPYAISQKYILIVNAILLIISLDAIKKKGKVY